MLKYIFVFINIKIFGISEILNMFFYPRKKYKCMIFEIGVGLGRFQPTCQWQIPIMCQLDVWRNDINI